MKFCVTIETKEAGETDKLQGPPLACSHAMFGTSASTHMRILHPLIFYPTWDFNPDHVRDTVTTTVYIAGFHVKDFLRVSESHKHCRGKLNP